ncbi:Acyl dehydratase [Geoglobus ahangari]|uniref:Acyl dehydratase n=1 Tax=Geoglobus ahangari TaxID=113653 RepID=A0A0F7IIS6_9EURY|nr:MaoC/PaaZ C-terminal domain-containing protein [Geoglobus ahangari]AKG92032.1 Acyl dehydratase [Geoglobus ahangari]
MTGMMGEGWYFEDYEVGREIKSSSRTVTEADIVNFAGITGDWNPIHTDEEFAKKSVFGRRVAHGTLTFAIMTGLFARLGIIERTIVAFYGVDRLRFVKPVFIGDTLTAVARIVDKEDRGNAGMIVMEASVVNQRGEVVLTGTVRFLVKKRGEVG